MRILHVLSSLDPAAGGVMTVVQGLSKAQQSQGMAVTVASNLGGSVDEQAVVGDLRDSGVEVLGLPKGYRPTRWSPGMARVLREAIGQQDLVHIHGLWEEIQHQAAVQSRAVGKPYYMAPHGMLDPWCLRQSALRKKLYLSLRLRADLDAASALHFTADQEAELVKPLGLKPPVIVEPNGLDVGAFSTLPGRAGMEAWLEQARGRLVLLFFGRLHPKKGLDLLLPAFAKLRMPDVLLVLAGPCDTAYQQQLQAQCESLGITEQVVFTGMLGGEQRLSVLSGADLFVLPSYQENFGMAIIEALLCGTAVVISDQINIHDAITAAGVGEVIPAEQSALEAALGRWLSDAEKRDAAAVEGPAFVRERYDWASLASRWAWHYQATLQSA